MPNFTISLYFSTILRYNKYKKTKRRPPMFFARPYKKAILSVLTACPLFNERWFFDVKEGDKLTLSYHNFDTKLTPITNQNIAFAYEKDGTFSALVPFPFLEDDERFTRLTDALEVIPDADLDDVAVYAERKHCPEPRCVAVLTIKGVTKETVKEATKSLCDAIATLFDIYEKGIDNDEE